MEAGKLCRPSKIAARGSKSHVFWPDFWGGQLWRFLEVLSPVLPVLPVLPVFTGFTFVRERDQKRLLWETSKPYACPQKIGTRNAIKPRGQL